VATRQRKDWRPEANGQYTRNLGWKLNERTGGYVQHKFYLGQIASRRNAETNDWSNSGSTRRRDTLVPDERRGTP